MTHSCFAKAVAQKTGIPATPASLKRLLSASRRDPSLRSGFRQQAPASLTPAKRLKTRSLAPLGISAAGSRFAHAC
jgi:hypothetical protein